MQKQILSEMKRIDNLDPSDPKQGFQSQIQLIAEKYKIEFDEQPSGQKTINFLLTIYQFQQVPFSIRIPSKYSDTQPTYTFTPPEGLTTAEIHKSNSPISRLVDTWSPGMRLVQMVEKAVGKIESTAVREEQLKTNVTYLTQFYEFLEGRYSLLYIAAYALILRMMIGYSPYSGQQYRNWLGLSYTRPASQWYVIRLWDQGKQWWPINYPPVTPYVLYLLSLPISYLEPNSLREQLGYETFFSRWYMRYTVIFANLVFYFIPLAIFCHSLKVKRSLSRLILLVGTLVPSFISVDHALVQYNCVAYGLVLYAYVCVIYKRYFLACIFFTLAVWSKLTASYYLLGFLSILVGDSLRRYGVLDENTYTWKFSFKGIIKFLATLFCYGCTIVGTTLVVFRPWISASKPEILKNAIQIIFSVDRGLYQNGVKLANFWALTDYFVSWQKGFTQLTLIQISIFLCVLGSLPSMIVTCYLPKTKYMMLAMFNISTAFYFFAYGEHQRHVVYTLLFVIINLRQLTYVGLDFIIFSAFSLSPLFISQKYAHFLFLGMLFYIFARELIRKFQQLKYVEEDNKTSSPTDSKFFNAISKLAENMKSFYYKRFRLLAYIAIVLVQFARNNAYGLIYLVCFIIFVYIYIYSNALMIDQAYKEVNAKRSKGKGNQ